MTEKVKSHKSERTSKYSVTPKLWMGFVAAGFSVLLAAGLGNLIGFLFPGLSELEEFAWSHFVPLPIAIIAAYFFLKKAGWLEGVFKSTPAYKGKHPRKWLLLFPILMTIQAIAALATTPWGNSSIGFVLIALLACILVGINEELYFRGILRFTSEQRRGQTITLLIVALTFGVAHSFGSLIEGLPLGFIAFQVGATATIGVAYYAAFVATGRLWVPIVFHTITDFTLRVGNGDTGIGPVSSADPPQIVANIQLALIILIVPLIISSIRYDLKVRKDKKMVEAK